MKRNQVDKMFESRTKKRNTIIVSSLMILIIFIFAMSFFFIYLERNKDYYITYSEDSNVDYKVYLKENEFFENEYLESNKQYIASLIDKISATFKYNVSIDEEDIDYQYSYSLEAVVNVKEKSNGNSIYSMREDIVLPEDKIANSNHDVNILENVDIDYSKYNNLIRRFVSVYDLDDVVSTLSLNMYVQVVGSCEKLKEDIDNKSVMTLTIPLTTKTTAIDISNDMVDSSDNVMVCKTMYKYNFVLLILSGFMLFMDIVLVVKLIMYIVNTRTPESIYERELKKILNNYRSYIQKINNNFDLKKYQIMKVDTFTDMLEIRDTLQQPILMIENDEKTGVYFAIPSNTKLLYVFALKVSDIKKRIEEKN